MNKTKCEAMNCRKPCRGARWRVWVYGEHYDYRTRRAAERAVARMSWHEQQGASVEAIANITDQEARTAFEDAAITWLNWAAVEACHALRTGRITFTAWGEVIHELRIMSDASKGEP